MLKLGEKQELQIEKTVDFGCYLTDPEDAGERVLLPKSQVPEGAADGDIVEVFLYRDSEDRLIATRKEPALTLHTPGFLTVKQETSAGAFLDWGLDKDLLLPFREQPRGVRVHEGQSCLVAPYIDKTGRLCATMNVYPYLRTDSPYKAGDHVTGLVYWTSDNFGTFVAVDNLYSALIPKREPARQLQPGETVTARVSAVKPDGKLDLSLREKAYIQMDTDADSLLHKMESCGGSLPFRI
jgi:predicted RNA-binding protein (virulence factor B family)